ncbi:MAG: hypothetical protein C0485_19645 [Pirellula sp.]|nr:hypothetical protein [Pirellula sp.]
MTDVTQILSWIDAGDPTAAEQLLPLVYEELKKSLRPSSLTKFQARPYRRRRWFMRPIFD